MVKLVILVLPVVPKYLWFISATMVSGLRRVFILQLCTFRLCCNFEENLLQFSHSFILKDKTIAETSLLKIVACTRRKLKARRKLSVMLILVRKYFMVLSQL